MNDKEYKPAKANHTKISVGFILTFLLISIIASCLSGFWAIPVWCISAWNCADIIKRLPKHQQLDRALRAMNFYHATKTEEATEYFILESNILMEMEKEHERPRTNA